MLGNSYVQHIFRPVTIVLKLNDPAKHIVNVSVDFYFTAERDHQKLLLKKIPPTKP